METIIGKWKRRGVEMSITRDKVITRVLDGEDYKTLVHDYLLEKDKLQLFDKAVHVVKKPFKGEAKITMHTHDSMRMEMDGSITFWSRR